MRRWFFTPVACSKGTRRSVHTTIERWGYLARLNGFYTEWWLFESECVAIRRELFHFYRILWSKTNISSRQIEKKVLSKASDTIVRRQLSSKLEFLHECIGRETSVGCSFRWWWVRDNGFPFRNENRIDILDQWVMINQVSGENDHEKTIYIQGKKEIEFILGHRYHSVIHVFYRLRERNLLLCCYWLPFETGSQFWAARFQLEDASLVIKCIFSANSICIEIVSQSNGIQLQGGRHHVQVDDTWLGWCRCSNGIIFSQPWSNVEIEKIPIFDANVTH